MYMSQLSDLNVVKHMIKYETICEKIKCDISLLNENCFSYKLQVSIHVHVSTDIVAT
jgi:hypothetical protein